ncbi:MAG: hypothetical protein AUH43_18795 [Acidobacteria bacterium 13_1_40CM_65_14]|nr:MAG: hypothetical protein AUH43_18795 [Acidobacteria bacterium 13_1_40CM_65_14]
MLRSPLVALWLTAVLPATMSAQPPADFSGRWTLDAPAIWGSTITIGQDTKRLNVEYTIFSRYDLQPPLTFTYPLDGSVGRNTVMMGRGEQIESSRAQWNGQTLIIITTFDITEHVLRGAGKPFTAELTRKLWLESPTTLVVEVTRAGVLGGPASTTRSVYRKG